MNISIEVYRNMGTFKVRMVCAETNAYDARECEKLEHIARITNHFILVQSHVCFSKSIDPDQVNLPFPYQSEDKR